jgi:hypothetical protein
MGNFQTVALTEDKLAGLSILELRIMRENSMRATERNSMRRAYAITLHGEIGINP